MGSGHWRQGYRLSWWSLPVNQDAKINSVVYDKYVNNHNTPGKFDGCDEPIASGTQILSDISDICILVVHMCTAKSCSNSQLCIRRRHHASCSEHDMVPCYVIMPFTKRRFVHIKSERPIYSSSLRCDIYEALSSPVFTT